MDDKGNKKIDEYLELFQKLKQETGSESVALALTQEIAKDDRTNQIQEQINLKNNEPATFKQRKLMDNLGIQYPKNISKREASTLIGEQRGRNNNSF